MVFTMFSFIIHALLKMNTGYYENGQKILERKSIIINYLKAYLFYDIITFWGLIESHEIIFDFNNSLSFLNVLILF